MTTKIANILQCYALGMGIKQISRSFELSRNTVRRYVRLFQECGIPIKVLAVTGNRHNASLSLRHSFLSMLPGLAAEA